MLARRYISCSSCAATFKDSCDQTSVSESLDQARINFINAFGGLPGDIQFDAALIDSLLPREVTSQMETNAPAIQSEYYAYKAAEANLKSVQAKDNYSISFRSTFSRPIGGSDYSSDESIGIVVNRTLYDGNKLDSELARRSLGTERKMMTLLSRRHSCDRKCRANSIIYDKGD